MSNRIIMAAAGVSTGGSISSQRFVSRLESVTMGSFTSSAIAINQTTKEVYLAFRSNVSKFNADGTLAWQRTLTYSTNNFNITGICVLPNNNVVVMAEGVTTAQAIVTKLNPTDGTLIDVRSIFASIDTCSGIDILALSDNSYLAVFNNGGSSFPSYASLAKISSANAIQWSVDIRDLAESGHSNVSTCVDPNGDVYVLVNKAGTTYYVFKINSSGALTWQRSFSGYTGLIRGIDASSDSVYVFGNDQTNGRFNLTKLVGSTGAVSWERSITVTGTRIAGPVRVGPDGAIYCLGSLNTAGIGVEDLVIYKFDASGNSTWQRAFGTAADDGTGNPTDLLFDGLGNYYITGDAATNSRVYVARLPTDGTLTGTYTPYTYSTITHTVSTTATVSTATSTETFGTGGVSLATPTITTPTTSFTATRTLL